MDIQKEREAFEQHLTDTGLVEFAGYGFAVDECDEYLHEPTQVAWDSWLIGLNRTKAQAVPEGFVLVPAMPSDEFIDKLADVICNEFDTTISGSAHCAREAYKAMVSNCEP